jgi:uracil-DNA glycosylase family 4
MIVLVMNPVTYQTTWARWLPRRAVVMTRRNRPVANDEASSRLCHLCNTERSSIEGRGNRHSPVLFVDEHRAGVNNEATELLERMIQAMGLIVSEIYTVYAMDCFHPSGVLHENSANCARFLHDQIQKLQPKVIVSLGEISARHLLEMGRQEMSQPLSKELNLSALRGKFLPLFNDAQWMPTFHPEHLLKHTASKRDTWTDLKAVANALGIQIPKR